MVHEAERSEAVIDRNDHDVTLLGRPTLQKQRPDRVPFM
jgi:hypothetical protein